MSKFRERQQQIQSQIQQDGSGQQQEHQDQNQQQNQHQEQQQQQQQQEQQQQNQAFDFSKIKQEDLFGYLSEQTKRKISSYDDLVEKVEVEVMPELAPEIEAAQKFVSETGRGFMDFMNANKDWNTEKEDRVLAEFYKLKNPGLESEDIEFLINDQLRVPSELDPEKHTEEELAENKNAIRRAELIKKQKVAEARSFLEDHKNKYWQPVDSRKAEIEQRIQQGKEAWKENTAQAIESIQSLKSDDFEYNYKSKESMKSANSVEGLIDLFKVDGKLDYSKLYSTVMTGLEVNDILKAHKSHIESGVKEQSMRQRSNAGGQFQERNEQSDKGEAEKNKEDFLSNVRKRHGARNFRR